MGNDFIKISEKKISDLYPLNFIICENCKTCQIDHTIPKEKCLLITLIYLGQLKL